MSGQNYMSECTTRAFFRSSQQYASVRYARNDAVGSERKTNFDSLKIRECHTLLCAPCATGRNNPFMVSSRHVAVADVIPKKPIWCTRCAE